MVVIYWYVRNAIIPRQFSLQVFNFIALLLSVCYFYWFSYFGCVDTTFCFP